jgi:hypothetical protein
MPRATGPRATATSSSAGNASTKPSDLGATANAGQLVVRGSRQWDRSAGDFCRDRPLAASLQASGPCFWASSGSLAGGACSPAFVLGREWRRTPTLQALAALLRQRSGCAHACIQTAAATRSSTHRWPRRGPPRHTQSPLSKLPSEEATDVIAVFVKRELPPVQPVRDTAQGRECAAASPARPSRCRISRRCASSVPSDTSPIAGRNASSPSSTSVRNPSEGRGERIGGESAAVHSNRRPRWASSKPACSSSGARRSGAEPSA